MRTWFKKGNCYMQSYIRWCLWVHGWAFMVVTARIISSFLAQLLEGFNEEAAVCVFACRQMGGVES